MSGRTDIIHRDDRWEQVKLIYYAALEQSPQEQKEYVRAACLGDQSLEHEVERLITHDRLAGCFMEEPATNGVAPAIVRGRSRAEGGRLVGPYRLLSEIGRGSMGKVYRAERADTQYQKQVAIKLVRPGLGSQSVIDHFRHERQILAGLGHSNIAKLLDGGTTEDGLPYFVMEFIEGIPIDEYRDRHQLSLVQTLELFRIVCAAVHYAHQNRVVHYDIKPSNILVTAEGAPKLLDFGIAKILTPASSLNSVETTSTLRFLTHEYASPEQVLREPITTASDVYSLGVLLYRLLTGSSPYRLDSRIAQNLGRAICQDEPERPSAAITRQVNQPPVRWIGLTTVIFESVRHTMVSQPEKLRRRLAGDLDNIVLMALRKEPGRRYSSVEQFSDDIRRHLEGLPVIARKATFSYRMT